MRLWVQVGGSRSMAAAALVLMVFAVACGVSSANTDGTPANASDEGEPPLVIVDFTPRPADFERGVVLSQGPLAEQALEAIPRHPDATASDYPFAYDGPPARQGWSPWEPLELQAATLELSLPENSETVHAWYQERLEELGYEFKLRMTGSKRPDELQLSFASPADPDTTVWLDLYPTAEDETALRVAVNVVIGEERPEESFIPSSVISVGIVHSTGGENNVRTERTFTDSETMRSLVQAVNSLHILRPFITSCPPILYPQVPAPSASLVFETEAGETWLVDVGRGCVPSAKVNDQTRLDDRAGRLWEAAQHAVDAPGESRATMTIVER